VSHDRYFLENVATRWLKSIRIYPNGILRVHGNYSTFLKERRILHAQSKRQEARKPDHSRLNGCVAEAKLGQEVEGRIDKANDVNRVTADLNERPDSAQPKSIFSASDRQDQTIRLNWRMSRNQSKSYALRKGSTSSLPRGMRVGLVGPNGSGAKRIATTLREICPDRGRDSRAEWLRVVYFDQSRET